MNPSATGRTIVIIPARFGSERLPGKPLAQLAGRPMIQHVVERARQSRLVHDVIVATDDTRIADAVGAFGGTAVMTPTDITSGTDRIAFVASTIPDATIVVNVQGDEPLIEPALIDDTIRPLHEDPAVMVATPVRAIVDQADLVNPAVPKVVLDRNGNCLYFSRSPIPFLRDVPPSEWTSRHEYYKHIGLYVFRRDFLLRYADFSQTPLERAEKLEQLRILEHGLPIRGVVTTFDSVPVDTPADLDRVRSIIETRHG